MLFTTEDFNSFDCVAADDAVGVIGDVVAVAFDIVVAVIVVGAVTAAVVAVVLSDMSSRRLRPAVRFFRCVSLQISSYMVLDSIVELK